MIVRIIIRGMAPTCLFIAGVCLTRAPTSTDSLFGYADFLTGLALLALVFTQSDPVYRFRISIAPLPLGAIAFAAVGAVGGGSLVTDLWFALGWYSLPWGVSKALIQGILASFLFLTILLWLTFAFALPPRFGRTNSEKFLAAIYRGLAFGGDGALSAIAFELRRSCSTIIASCNKPGNLLPGSAKSWASKEKACAVDVLRLIADRRLCRHIVAASPGTAIGLMQEATQQRVFRAPLGQFSQNITIEALKNRESPLHYEDDLSNSGLLSRIQPFTRAMYGSFELVEGSSEAMCSALDLDYRETDDLKANEWEAYGRALTTTTADFFKSKNCDSKSYVLNRSIENIVTSTNKIYMINGLSDWQLWRDEWSKLRSAMSVIETIIRQIDENQKTPDRKYINIEKKHYQRDFVDIICEALFEIMFNVASVKHPTDTAWSIQHNTFWTKIDRSSRNSKTWKVVNARFSRLAIKEISGMRKYANFRQIKIVGLLLNVFGVHEKLENPWNSDFAFLRRYVIALTKKTYLKIVAEQPHVAEAALIGSVTFDAERKRLIKTYAQGLSFEPSREYLDLDDWDPSRGEKL